MNKKTTLVLFFSVFLFLSNCSKKVDIEISEIAKSQVSMAVNAFLWRASLDTVSFIPLDIVDLLHNLHALIHVYMQGDF